MKKIISILVLSLAIVIIGSQLSTTFVYADDENTQTEGSETNNPNNDQPIQVDK